MTISKFQLFVGENEKYESAGKHLISFIMTINTYRLLSICRLVESKGRRLPLFARQLCLQLADLLLHFWHFLPHYFHVFLYLIHFVPHWVSIVTEEVTHLLVWILRPLLLSTD